MLDDFRSRLEAELKRVGPDAVAACAGVSRATVYNWMTKGNTPLDKLALLTAAGVNTAHVLFGETQDAFIARQQRINYANALARALPLTELSREQLAAVMTGDPAQDAALIADALSAAGLPDDEHKLLAAYRSADDAGKHAINTVAAMAAKAAPPGEAPYFNQEK